MEKLTGKLIVRPTAISNGKPALLVFGVLNYEDIANVSKSDECWVVDLDIAQIIKWKSKNHSPTWNLSPEDILQDFANKTRKETWLSDIKDDG